MKITKIEVAPIKLSDVPIGVCVEYLGSLYLKISEQWVFSLAENSIETFTQTTEIIPVRSEITYSYAYASV